MVVVVVMFVWVGVLGDCVVGMLIVFLVVVMVWVI